MFTQDREAAVESTVEDGLLSLDEENALYRYLEHFGITANQADQSGIYTSVVKAAVLREIAEGIISQRQNITGRVPLT